MSKHLHGLDVASTIMRQDVVAILKILFSQGMFISKLGCKLALAMSIDQAWDSS